MRHRSILLALLMSLSLVASAEPRRGQTMPTFSVEDIAGATHTPRDLTGRWSFVCVMTDKDTHPHVRAWYLRLHQAAPALPFITMAALDLFPLIPTGVLRSQAQESTPRSRWNEVWLSRDGSLARSLGLPESEVPWVAVVAPDGRVVEIVHALLNDEVFARIMAALPAAPSRAAR